MLSTLQIASLSLIGLPNSRDFHIISCLQTILQNHIVQRTNIIVSFPAYTNNTVLTPSKTDTLQVVDSVLQNIWCASPCASARPPNTFYFNPHASFIFMINGCFTNIIHFLRLIIYNMWTNFKNRIHSVHESNTCSRWL